MGQLEAGTAPDNGAMILQRLLRLAPQLGELPQVEAEEVHNCLDLALEPLDEEERAIFWSRWYYMDGPCMFKLILVERNDTRFRDVSRVFRSDALAADAAGGHEGQ